ncbi:TPA: hypothetical protein DIU27_00940 [Candidatus Collierbacteria bacterium]|uniref:Uncharacterized protein n=1 Tax=Candidatus Collierbacteria bacterium GW2011_GWB2_44_22 TaxID=1618387 RepID=A0A0G1K6W5_9BACT|nr:MAG: hypothetical protein UW31_C0010G0039 [Candidatus Collierbacteria bacterium GW2011_GWA2_44_13]KKT52067.1 MAG: hypothetical protein UW44_C0005G0109 [Candidatus Collierbacteria bacterium GW2011_GWB2_44_22]KKT62603.1 MAG: hypothetical protein UW56_C0005G0039 [Candidatus Collierbacteria bacterium GW2011_GWD1_44_27]KKT66021.1 MAG: hypothetical protein UW58_C0014G0008 [Candidatus Collierbacteria bacterium GW2011_GWC2_44_30]KKT68071.1 MAG: hypothetical protein UW64_C0030G0019 [Microgenomates gr
MAYLIFALVVAVIGVLVWRPWGKATLFGGDVAVEYKGWEGASGCFGKKVNLRFNLHEKYRIRIDSPTFRTKDILIHQYDVTQTPMDVSIDVESCPRSVKITIKELKEDGKTEICRLYAF